MKLFISGHTGMVGGALVRRFQKVPGVTLVTRTRQELNLADQAAVAAFYAAEKPDAAIIAAGKVGGIHANNTYPAEFIYENLAIATHCIHSAWTSGVKRLLFLGSSCIYPKLAPQPMHEDCLLSSALEPTNAAYAIAKIAGVKMAEYYRKQYGVVFHSAMPTNLYGPGDNYHPQNSHVMPALIRRFHEAKVAGLSEVKAWGTGQPRREFMHVDDLADACAHLMQLAEPPDLVNVGFGSDITIRELVELVAAVVDYVGEIVWDESKPDGSPRKLLDTSRLNALGWRPHIQLKDGLEHTYRAFLAELEANRLRG
ncbi:MAG: GDP-L-fucose synthase family protein [Prosthecobacter sp.]|uniref:GDP-L-fucose synthase family protein n=1 Tax=Prosthecobacter sp. TaxID=1965333 RepID=UPI0038FF8AE0